MIERETFMPLKFIQKSPFTGSYQGMRYLLKKGTKGLEVYLYPEPFCFEKTPDEQKQYKEFPFTEEGLELAYAYLNRQYQEQKEKWDCALGL